MLGLLVAKSLCGKAAPQSKVHLESKVSLGREKEKAVLNEKQRLMKFDPAVGG